MATYLGHQEDSSGNILLPTPHSMATQIEFGTTASQAYAKGAYVVFNNRLCKASTAIASGDTLAIGTNLVQCSIGSELNSHLQAPNGSEFYFDYKDNKPGFYPSASKVASEFVPFGGSLSETVLWTNPSPTTAQQSQTVTLAGNISNFDLIKITYRKSTADATELSVYCDITKSISPIMAACLIYNAANRGYYCRSVSYDSNTSVKTSYAGRWDAGGSDQSMAIVTTICGVKL